MKFFPAINQPTLPTYLHVYVCLSGICFPPYPAIIRDANCWWSDNNVHFFHFTLQIVAPNNKVIKVNVPMNMCRELCPSPGSKEEEEVATGVKIGLGAFLHAPRRNESRAEREECKWEERHPESGATCALCSARKRSQAASSSPWTASPPGGPRPPFLKQPETPQWRNKAALRSPPAPLFSHPSSSCPHPRPSGKVRSLPGFQNFNGPTGAAILGWKVGRKRRSPLRSGSATGARDARAGSLWLAGGCHGCAFAGCGVACSNLAACQGQK